jgi:hypothetical protein
MPVVKVVTKQKETLDASTALAGNDLLFILSQKMKGGEGNVL